MRESIELKSGNIVYVFASGYHSYDVIQNSVTTEVNYGVTIESTVLTIFERYWRCMAEFIKVLKYMCPEVMNLIKVNL